MAHHCRACQCHTHGRTMVSSQFPRNRRKHVRSLLRCRCQIISLLPWSAMPANHTLHGEPPACAYEEADTVRHKTGVSTVSRAYATFTVFDNSARLRSEHERRLAVQPQSAPCCAYTSPFRNAKTLMAPPSTVCAVMSSLKRSGGPASNVTSLGRVLPVSTPYSLELGTSFQEPSASRYCSFHEAEGTQCVRIGVKPDFRSISHVQRHSTGRSVDRSIVFVASFDSSSNGSAGTTAVSSTFARRSTEPFVGGCFGVGRVHCAHRPRCVGVANRSALVRMCETAFMRARHSTSLHRCDCTAEVRYHQSCLQCGR